MTKADPAHAADYATNLDIVLGSLKRIDARAAVLRGKYKGLPVTATEPVFGLMAQAIGLVNRNERFQIAMMNDTEPTAHDLAEFERDLKERRVKVLFYNSQVSEAMTTRLRDIAKASKVPVVPVTETLPAGMHFQDWVLSELDALDKALGTGQVMKRLGNELLSILPTARKSSRVNGNGHDRRRRTPERHFAHRRPHRAARRQLRHPAGRVHRRARTERLRQDDLDARRARPLPAGRRHVCAYSGTQPHRGDPAIGYLPQTRTVIPDLRVRGLDFIGASLDGHRWGLPARNAAGRRMIAEALDAVGARELATRPLSEMSGGERQRLLLAQALIGNPKLLLLDEPLIMLDARHQEVAIDVVRKVCRERGITVLFSAHELNQLLGAIDRVLYLGQRPGRAGRDRRGRHRAGVIAALRHRDRGAARRRAYLRHVARLRRRARRAHARS